MHSCRTVCATLADVVTNLLARVCSIYNQRQHVVPGGSDNWLTQNNNFITMYSTLIRNWMHVNSSTLYLTKLFLLRPDPVVAWSCDFWTSTIILRPFGFLLVSSCCDARTVHVSCTSSNQIWISLVVVSSSSSSRSETQFLSLVFTHTYMSH